MKVLFVCHGNVDRSQSVMEYFKSMSDDETDSAGTVASDPNTRIGDFPGAIGIVEAMKEDGTDISNNYPKRLTNAADTPDWLTSSPKYEYWKIQDLADVPLKGVRAPRDQIKKLVQALVIKTI